MTDNRESLMAYLKTALEGITTAAGYNYTVARVTRKMRNITELVERPAIAIGDPEVRHERVGVSSSGYFDRVYLTILVVGLLKTDDPETDINYFAHDIERAALTHASAPHKQMSNCTQPDIILHESMAEGGEGLCRLELQYFFDEEIT